ncbi:cupin domain-containing protein [Spirochaetota bacterium]
MNKNDIFKLKEKCLESSDREIFYGAKINDKIQDVYLGMGFLEPGEVDRKEGPGKGHEEIIYILNGKVQIATDAVELILEEGSTYYIEDGLKITLKNMANERCYFIIAGGHTVHHSH